MNQPVINPSPKTRFMRTAEHCSKHRALVDLHEFERASDYAMLEYAARLSATTEPALASVTALKIQGAHEFLQTFRNLAEPAARFSAPVISDNLNHNQK
jgi:hypothetical protein